MENALNQLNSAIEARIDKENAFIQRITDEFARISAGLQRTASSSSPQVQADLAPFIQRIDAATAKLKDRSSFGDGDNSDLEALVRAVTGNSGSGSSGSSPGFLSGLSSMFSRPTPPATPAATRVSRAFGRDRPVRPTQRDARRQPTADDMGELVPDVGEEDYQDPLLSEPAPPPGSDIDPSNPRFNDWQQQAGRRGGWKTTRSKRSKRSRRRPH